MSENIKNSNKKVRTCSHLKDLDDHPSPFTESLNPALGFSLEYVNPLRAADKERLEPAPRISKAGIDI